MSSDTEDDLNDSINLTVCSCGGVDWEFTCEEALMNVKFSSTFDFIKLFDSMLCLADEIFYERKLESQDKSCYF